MFGFQYKMYGNVYQGYEFSLPNHNPDHLHFFDTDM